MRHKTRPNRSFSNAVERGDRLLREATAGAQARTVAYRCFAPLHRLPVVQDGARFVRSRLLVTFQSNILTYMLTFTRIQHRKFHYYVIFQQHTYMVTFTEFNPIRFIIILFLKNSCRIFTKSKNCEAFYSTGCSRNKLYAELKNGCTVHFHFLCYGRNFYVA